MDDSPELQQARADLAAAEARINTKDESFDVRDLPRVDLNDVLAHYDPVSVGTEAGREYIVVAPRSELEGLHGPDTRAPVSIVRNQREVRALQDARMRDIESGYQMALQDFGVGEEPDKGKRIGIGSVTGTQRPHDRVNFVQQVGVSESELGTEIGTAVASPWTAWTRREYNQELFGFKGLRVYDKMRKSDGTVRGTLRLGKTPVLSGRWDMIPASDSTRDQNIRDFVWKNLTQWMSTSWPQFLTEALLMLDFGYYMFEKVFAHGEDVTADPTAKGKIVWKKFAPRHPMDVKEWFMDINGGPLSVDMWAPPVSVGDQTPWGSPSRVPNTFQGGVIQAFQRWINIPIDKLLVFSFDKEAGNIEGISVLRSAYKHWYYKDNLYKIDAIQKERHGIGIPVVMLPVGYSPQDKALADQLGRNLRTNDRAHVVLPPNWTLTFAELKGHPVDCLPSIKHHDQMIPTSILGQFMVTEKTDIEEQHTIFLKATRFTADIVLDVINSYAIPQLVNMNWGRSVYPKLIVRRIGEQEDWRTLSFTLRNYVGAGIIVPDDKLENALRDDMGLPRIDAKTARLVRGTPMENEQRINPAPTELPGPGHKVLPNQMPGQPKTPNQPANAPGGQNVGGAPQLPGVPRIGPPRQSAPSPRPPNLGGGDGSGKSKRRGQ